MMERKRVLVAFGDIRGFRKWILRAMNSPEIAGETMDDAYRIFEHFVLDLGYYIKFLGDGFMIVKELGNGHNCGKARKLLTDVSKLTAEVLARINTAYPRPDGFRVRVTTGHVWKRQTIMRVHGRFVKHPEYIGYAVNMAQSLLYVYPEVEGICHEGVVEIMGGKKLGLTLDHLKPPNERRSGIDPTDFSGLWKFQIEQKGD